jgi:dsRNA-specific ribonuclease
VQVVVDTKKLGDGTSGSKKEAEQIASKQAYESLTAQKKKGD